MPLRVASTRAMRCARGNREGDPETSGYRMGRNPFCAGFSYVSRTRAIITV
jgi:hypothetical protein